MKIVWLKRQTYAYDEKDQLTQVVYGDESDTVNFSYDLAGNLTSLNNNDIEDTYVYDELNRVTSITRDFEPFTKTVEYTYDRFGNTATMTDGESNITSYTYDAFNRLTQIDFTDTHTLSYEYDLAGRLTKKTLPTGTYTEYTYDKANRLTKLVNKKANGTELSSFTYSLDAVGNRTSMVKSIMTTSGSSSGTHGYTYDDIYRLTAANHPGSSDDETYTYDAVGNRSTNQDYSDWTHNDNNELTHFGRTDFDYDLNGNRTQKDDGAVTNYTYDIENRLIEVDTNDTDVFYQYDPFGKRISRYDGTDTEYYCHANEDVIADYDENGNLLRKTWHGIGIDEPIAVLDNSDTYYYLTDGLGSVVQLIDENENVVKHYEYDAFGNTINETGSIEQRYRFTSREWDKDIGLYYYRVRHYDPEAGRFLTEDPIGFIRGDLNYYEYVINNPINFTDPTGMIIQINGDDKETKQIINMLSKIAGVSIKTNCYGVVSGEFTVTPLNKYSELAAMLKEITESNKYIQIKFGNVLSGGGGFTSGFVTIDYEFGAWSYKGIDGFLHKHTGESILTHELLGHGLDYIRGISEFDKKAWENRAIKRANIYHEMQGLPLRKFEY